MPNIKALLADIDARIAKLQATRDTLIEMEGEVAKAKGKSEGTKRPMSAKALKKIRAGQRKRRARERKEKAAAAKQSPAKKKAAIAEPKA